MLFDALTVSSFALHLLLVDFAEALRVPSPAPPAVTPPPLPNRSLHIPLLRRAVPHRNESEFGLWAKQQKQLLESKYGHPTHSSKKRSSGTNLCVRTALSFNSS